MLSRYAIACRPVHDLIVDYLREQQLTVDHATLRSMAHVLGKLFWRDLERHHPGIGSLRLAPEVAAGWKQRILVKTSRSVTAAGDAVETSAPRTAAAGALFTVRAFYLDIAQWAADDPARWAPWAAPCPIRDGEVPHAKELSRRKARMDQRTRERLPALPVLTAAAGEERAASSGPARRRVRRRPGRAVHRRRADPAPLSDVQQGKRTSLGRRARHRETPRPHPRRTPRVLGLGRRRGPAALRASASRN